MTLKASPWPSKQEAAISLTFDDGLPSQLTSAAPMLEAHGLRATFYLNPQNGYDEQLRPWRAVVEAGHEVGNHTVNHPCSVNFGFVVESGRRPLEKMTLQEMEDEILEAGRRIDEALPPQGPISFAYPCYQPYVGRGADRRSYVPLVARHCAAGRGRGERANDPAHCDLAYLWSWPCERMTGAQLIGLAELAVTQGRWAILTFHGIHEGHLPVAASDLEELCRHLAASHERVWTAPVATVAAAVADFQRGDPG